jgi:UDP-N-acetylmuramoyl-tripeptide--D-alanyl-D-alanine ligase
MSLDTLVAVAESVKGHLVGSDAGFAAVSTDTRTLNPGDLLFALKGENFDAADFVLEAARKGAVGAVVERHVAADIAQIEVADSRKALGDYAAAWRRRHSIPAVGITGSNGKTTVKEMVTAILVASLGSPEAVLATRGNFNNDVGVPLTVLRLRKQHRAAVFEMGASAAGEIAYLAGIAAPQVGIVTCAGAAHLEGFGSLAGVASAKGEMFTSLPESGVAILNRDDSFYEYWRDRCSHVAQLSFGQNNAADFFATNIEEDPLGLSLAFQMHCPLGSVPLVLPMAGRHNVLNALAAAAAAVSVGADLDAVVQGLKNTGNVGGRLRAVAANNGMRVFDDSYNANPDSVKAAIQFLAAQTGRRWLVLGDMGELGADAPVMHRSVGEAVAAAGIDRLLCVGELSRETVAGCGANAEWFESVPALIEYLQSVDEAHVTLLVKASRFMRLELVVKALTQAQTEGVASGC